MVKIAGATSTKNPYGLVPSWDVSCWSDPVPLVSLRKALVPPWFKEMEPRYRDSRVARNSAISTRYLAAFAAICLVSTIVLSIGALMLSTFSDDQIARAICICLDVCFLLSACIACDYRRNRGYVAIGYGSHASTALEDTLVDQTRIAPTHRSSLGLR